MRAPAWSTAMMKFERPSTFCSRKGGGSSAASSLEPAPPAGAEAGALVEEWSVGFCIAATDLTFIEIFQRLDLRPLE